MTKFDDTILDLDDKPFVEAQTDGTTKNVTYRNLIISALNATLKGDERENGKVAGKKAFDRFMLAAQVRDLALAGADMPGPLGTEDIEMIKERVALISNALAVGRVFQALDPVGSKGKAKAN
jgi:hypothetical protein